MYIAPQSIFKVITDIPFGNDHKHTILFNSASQQQAYFNAKTKYTFSNFSYVRKENVVRVPVVADNLYNANYCAFKNVGFGNKWFYGFITNVEYINNEVSAISVDVDWMQTFLFDFTIGNSYTVREHVADDTIGAHTIPEDISFGENVVMQTMTHYFTNWKCIIVAIPNTSSAERRQITVGQVDGKVIKNLYTGGTMYLSDLDADNINQIITNLISNGLIVSNIYTIPNEFLNYFSTPITEEETGTRPTSLGVGNKDDAYTPINNKLLTYPYTFLRVENNQGGVSEFRWEDSNSGTGVNFLLLDNYVNACECCLQPQNYQKSGNRSGSLYIGDFPQCSWSEDAVASNMSSKNISATIASVLSLNPQHISERVEDIATSFVQPETPKGNYTSAYLDAQNDQMGYSFYTMGIRAEMARVVDDYFTRFGYKVLRYKVPELRSRTSFNYVKTEDAYITGSIPNEALEQIANAFNSGITLWHTTDVGNYSLDNSIVKEV